jgi:membrane-associated protein
LVYQNVIEFNIHLLVGILFAAAALGDSVGYAFGHRVGRKLFRRKDSLLFHKDNLRRAEEFYEKHGAKTIVLARFVPVIRTFAPIIAGISSMSYRKFLAYNLIGAFLWTAGLTYLGYYAGSWIEAAGINIEYVILAIIFVSILPPIIHVLREPEGRTQLKAGLTHLRRRLFH